MRSGVLPPGATAAPGAYVHVPFCAHRCSYCSFVALEGTAEEGDYFHGLEREIRSRGAGASGLLRNLDSVYFGGGTPSFVDAVRLRGALGALEESFGLSSGAEITAEANPDDLDAAKLAALGEVGINRLSVGVQSLADAELVFLERRHDAASARRAVGDAVSTFGNVSADLMIGIPGQTRATLRASLDGLLEAGVSHLSAYLLEIEKAPKLVALKGSRPDLFADDDEMADRWLELDERLDAAGLLRYEISNWARPGFESRHNLKYWTLAPVLGFGVAAHSFDGRRRSANSGSLTEYLRRTREGLSPVVTSGENGGGLPGRKEGVMLGLRLARGVPSSSFEEVRCSLPAAEASRIGDVFEAGLLEVTGEGETRRVRLTRRGVLLSNEVFSLFL
ncbi:MAG TPA: radical SAM family heme chaperone HemW [Thermoanaerobaculia bacterium]|nr:radical SAM family heme chaperone HemW [Thermoanaerobaculia bacterium]